MLQKCMPFLLLLLLLLSSPVMAEDPSPEVSALADMSTRYTIGPWEGGGSGKACTLSNNEPLSLGMLEISLLHDQVVAKVTPVWPGAQPLLQEFPLDAAAKPRLQIDRYVYDTRGLDRAFSLFRQCLDGKLPETLPNEPLEESEPHSVGKTDWQIIRLMQGSYKYAGYAMLEGSPLGLWVHNTDSFLLSLTTPLQLKPPFVVSVNGRDLEAAPQEGGLLIPLPPEVLRQLEADQTLHLKVAGQDKVFPLKGFRDVVVALQPYE